MNKRSTTKKAAKPEVEQPVNEQPAEAQEPVNEQPAAENQPPYVKELLEKGVAIISGRTRREVDEKLSAIPCSFCAGPVFLYMDSGCYRVQVNLNE